MQPDNKHTDKKLQELENQSLPDLSKMDEHWQQMKTILTPGIDSPDPGAVTGKHYFRWIVAAIFISGLFMLASKLINQSKPADSTKGKAVQQAVIPVRNLPDTTGLVLLTNGKDTIRIKKSNPTGTPPISTLKAKTTTRRDTMIPVSPVDNKPEPLKENYSASLDLFFKQLEKQAQEFIINNKRDTLLSGDDGTVLLIPANTFNSKYDVVISMKEYYSYEDIITNKLSTSSNGKQLITGGMIHIMATVNGQEVNIQPGKSIRWFVPDTTKAMNQMQLFAGRINVDNQKILRESVPFDGDGVSQSDSIRVDGMNWIPQEQFFSNAYLVTSVKVLDLKNEPFKTRQTKKGEIGFFYIAGNPMISREELQAVLQEKYDYYKVKIKPRKKNNFFRSITPSFLKARKSLSGEELGDSAWVKDDVAKKYRLKATDTVTYIQGSAGYKRGSFAKEAFRNINLNNLSERFSVDIRSLGWINCDKFYNDGRPKIEYYVDLEDTAANYYTLLVFDKVRSMITGYTHGNKIVFSNVPEGESAKVVSVGIQNGKTVAAMKNVEISKTTLTNLKFEDASPASFKEEIKGLDK